MCRTPYPRKVARVRQCSKPGCSRNAVATLTYDYSNSTAVLGPIATSATPHAFDLCEPHADRLTVPRGWEVVRLQSKFEPAAPSPDDLLALVEVVREVAGRGGDSSDGPELPVPDSRGNGAPEDKYAPLRRQGRFTVITGDVPASEDEPQPPDPGSRPGPPAGWVQDLPS